jgi:hypothetical protein
VVRGPRAPSGELALTVRVGGRVREWWRAVGRMSTGEPPRARGHCAGRRNRRARRRSPRAGLGGRCSILPTTSRGCAGCSYSSSSPATAQAPRRRTAPSRSGCEGSMGSHRHPRRRRSGRSRRAAAAVDPPPVRPGPGTPPAASGRCGDTGTAVAIVALGPAGVSAARGRPRGVVARVPAGPARAGATVDRPFRPRPGHGADAPR